jgi:hypothetical protein
VGTEFGWRVTLAARGVVGREMSHEKALRFHSFLLVCEYSTFARGTRTNNASRVFSGAEGRFPRSAARS